MHSPNGLISAFGSSLEIANQLFRMAVDWKCQDMEQIMSQVFGSSLPVNSVLERAEQPAADLLGNSTRPVIAVNQSIGNQLSAWQQAVLRCIVRPSASALRKTV